jgi:hypothetical protein
MLRIKEHIDYQNKDLKKIGRFRNRVTYFSTLNLNILNLIVKKFGSIAFEHTLSIKGY